MKKLYAVYDIVAREIHGPILTFNADAAAIRTFSEILADNKTALSQHPADYTLLYLGTITENDDTLPQILASLGAEVILTGAQWLAVQEKNTGA